MAYALASFQGSLQAVRSINWYQHFTGIVSAHAHLAMLAGFSMILFASIYYIVPRIYKVEWYSRQLVNVHFWMMAGGFVAFFSAWTTMGFVQAAAWNMGINVQQTVPFLGPFIAVRWMGAATMVASIYLFGYNALQTVRIAQRQNAAVSVGSLAPAAADD
jgi:cytochrome c oxidase cbb3-type subunit I